MSAPASDPVWSHTTGDWPAYPCNVCGQPTAHAFTIHGDPAAPICPRCWEVPEVRAYMVANTRMAVSGLASSAQPWPEWRDEHTSLPHVQRLSALVATFEQLSGTRIETVGEAFGLMHLFVQRLASRTAGEPDTPPEPGPDAAA